MALSLYTEASDLYIRGRTKGYTIRSSVDCLIAAVAIHHKVPVMHLDRDYRAIEQISDLKTVASLR